MKHPSTIIANFDYAGVHEPTTINITVPSCIASLVQKHIEIHHQLEVAEVDHDEISHDFPMTRLSYDVSENGRELQHDLVALNKWPVHIEVVNSADEYAFLYTKLHEGSLVYNTFVQVDECISARTVLNLIAQGDTKGLVRACSEAVERTRHWSFTEAEINYASQIALAELVKPKCPQ